MSYNFIIFLLASLVSCSPSAEQQFEILLLIIKRKILNWTTHKQKIFLFTSF